MTEPQGRSGPPTVPHTPLDGRLAGSEEVVRAGVPPDGRWEELRGLILGPEQQRLDAIDERLASPALTVDAVSRVLPDAVERRAGDRALGAALGPVVGDAIKASVRRDPQPVVDAIFPVIGPAIRKAISAAFAELVQSVNATLEHSFTLRGLRWRLEAMRTGRSFGEVVLSHSLAFRAEQLFLIHRETGLLVRHLTAPGIHALSPDMVAGMLTAITQFAQDSFEVSRQEGLDSLALGDLGVWVEQGPAVTLAAVVRGHPPAGYREVLQEAVEGVQRVHADALDQFARDGRPFEVRHDLLEPCLITQRVEGATSTSPWRLAAVGAIVLLAFGACAVPRWLEARRVDRWLARLRGEPGLVVGSVARAEGRAVVSGLRDPLAVDPAHLLSGFGLDTSDVRGHWEPYVALRPEFVVRRAGAALQPPRGVTLALRGDTLVATGTASTTWRTRAGTLALAIPGVAALDLAGLEDSAVVALRARGDTIAAFTLAFDRGAVIPRASSRLALDSLTGLLRRFVSEAWATGWRPEVEVRTATDSIGTPEANAWLRAERARTLRQVLRARGIPDSLLVASPDSSRDARQGYVRVHLRRTPGTP